MTADDFPAPDLPDFDDDFELIELTDEPDKPAETRRDLILGFIAGVFTSVFVAVGVGVWSTMS